MGNCVKFGTYWQSNNEEKEPIEWLVLDVEKGKTVLLISKYALDCKQYHKRNIPITWENSDLRKWLNEEFINNAFSEEEKEKIQLSEVINNTYIRGGRSGVWGENNTEDKLFLLSIDEALKYYNSNEKRQCKPTQFAVKNNGSKHEVSGICNWWLRSPGEYKSSATRVFDGEICRCITSVDLDNTCVRPALWVNLES